ncbi:MAG TPA: hypothetical protein VJT84_08855 [Gaiellaceae bacterium]|nr:hypothetical protein [Gaiellaceae bacterium]
MTASADPQRRSPPPPDVDAEQEVDFGRYWRLIAARWWVPVGLLVGGLVIGYLVSIGTRSDTYKATAQVYLGQPLAPGTATPLTTAPTALALVSHLVTSEATIRRVAAKAGLKVSRLRDHVETKPIVGITLGKIGTPAPLLDITVEGSPPAKIAVAANEMARLVVEQVSAITNTKIATFKANLAFTNTRLASVVKRLDVATRQLDQLLNVPGPTGSEKLISSLNLNNLLTYLESRQASLERNRIDIPQLIAQADYIEKGRILSPALAVRTAGPSSRTGAAIGGLIGLIVGIFAALLWEPVAARLNARNNKT